MENESKKGSCGAYFLFILIVVNSIINMMLIGRFIGYKIVQWADSRCRGTTGEIDFNHYKIENKQTVQLQ